MGSSVKALAENLIRESKSKGLQLYYQLCKRSDRMAQSFLDSCEYAFKDPCQRVARDPLAN